MLPDTAHLSPKRFQKGKAADAVGSFLCCHAKWGEGVFEGALTALPPHSLPLTLHLFARLERKTEKTLFGILTGPSIPGEEEEKFGAGDGDHLADVGVGPAGNLVPHPAASWAHTQRMQAEKGRLLSDTRFTQTLKRDIFLALAC